MMHSHTVHSETFDWSILSFCSYDEPDLHLTRAENRMRE